MAGHLGNLLPKKTKVRRVEHHAALSFAELAAFMAVLRRQQGVAAWALEFAILTAARTGEVIGAHWSEIDLAELLWTVPPRTHEGWARASRAVGPEVLGWARSIRTAAAASVASARPSMHL
ncbi:MAG TPA: hypothetical protein VGM07_20295 [Stellaceae bacterium]